MTTKQKVMQILVLPFYGLSYVVGLLVGYIMMARGAIITGWQDGIGAIRNG